MNVVRRDALKPKTPASKFVILRQYREQASTCSPADISADAVATASLISRVSKISHYRNCLLLLGAEHGSSDIGAGQPDVGSLLDLVDKVHARPVGAGPLKGGNVGHVDGCFGCQIFLRHGAALLVLEHLAGLLQRLGHIIGHLLCGDNVLAAVDLGQMLAFGALLCCLWWLLVSGCFTVGAEAGRGNIR